MKLIAFLIISVTFVASSMAQNKFTKTINMEKIDENTYETSRILITEKPQKKYQLTLKEGKPFEGYEVSNEVILDEFPLVNYYENGQLKNQYSIDYISKDQFSSPYEYALKSTFKNNKIHEGPVYRELQGSGFTILFVDIYSEGIQIGLQINTFAMHSFERLNMEVAGDSIIVSALKTNESLKIYKKENIVTADLLRSGQFVETSSIYIHKVSEGDPNSHTVFYVKDNGDFDQVHLKYIPLERSELQNELIASIYTQLSFEYTGSIQEVFDEICKLTQHTNANEFSFESILETLIVPYKRTNLKGFIVYDANVSIREGTKVTEKQNGTFELNFYEEGKIVDTKIIDDLKSYNPFL